ncbi:unnamed protein product [Rotaria sordida]|uniref:Alanine racemase C-terminal domain-containing protein n=1 Tax=Rotaria sordida TaxID=392033 RepID=A0A815HEN6_9BILA|nr:unnamed protein product [Rotaria sordida]
MLIVKAFAYGTGALPIALWAEKTGVVDYLAVSYVSEGVDLRCSGHISLPIMVMVVTEYEFDICRQFNLEPVMYSMHILDKLIQYLTQEDDQVSSNRFPDVHIKLDTGLHRLGISLNQISNLITELNANSHYIRVKSIYSHFIGSSNSKLDAITQRQADLFVSHAQTIEKALGYSVIKHICDSGGIIHHSNFHLNMVRLGAGLYGIWSVEPKIEFQRVVVSLFVPIIRLESVCENETVGYIQHRLNRSSLIGVISIGFADGLRRHLNNGEGRIWICNRRAPIINIAMDMTMIDLTDVDDSVKVNDQVEIFGEHIMIEEMAQWCRMSPYELLSGLGQRVKRVYVADNDAN